MGECAARADLPVISNTVRQLLFYNYNKKQAKSKQISRFDSCFDHEDGERRDYCNESECLKYSSSEKNSSRVASQRGVDLPRRRGRRARKHSEETSARPRRQPTSHVTTRRTTCRGGGGRRARKHSEETSPSPPAEKMSTRSVSEREGTRR